MTVPFRIGVMQLTAEPTRTILAQAKVMDEQGFDTIWLCEAYPWWRKHSLEARSLTALSALVGLETRKITVGWGIISPYTRHPIQVAMDARVTQELVGPDRLRIGLGASKIFMRHIGEGGAKPAKPVRVMRESMEIIRAVMAGEEVNYEGESFSAHVPALRPDAESARGAVPVYLAGTGPQMQRLAGRAADGLLTASITTPDFVRYTWDNVREGAAVAGRDPETIDVGCTLVSSIGEDEESGRDGAREIAAMYLANKVQNIQGAAEVLLQKANLEPDEIRPVAEAMERGGRLAAKAAVTDAILDKCKPIAGTPTQCIDRILEYKEAGCNHIMLEMWGADRERQLELFGTKVLPEVRK
ncbi:MAG TPA: LLM class flavin-dependent oxidoreductase [Mycobacterium sp.]|nr:LLM class flavin-dependent oxidoreductase [Mycobacterium sp.]